MVRLRDLEEGGVLQEFGVSVSQGIPALQEDAVLRHLCAQGLLLLEGIALHLVYHGDGGDPGKEFLQVSDGEIADAQGAQEAL